MAVITAVIYSGLNMFKMLTASVWV